jgi:cyclopropane fatty-acyl-phospholipid synthase-like methyltransferase
VLDLGCGSGLPATKEIAVRHEAVGVDISERQIELARTHVPEAQFALADALSLELPPASFDAVVAFYVLDHIPRERYGDFFRNICEWLRPEGWFLFTAETEDHPGEVSEWLGESMFFNSLDPEDIRRLVTEAGFEAVRSEIESQIEGEKKVPYLWVLTRKVS